MQIEMFSRKTSSKDGRMSICKICDVAKAKKWYFENSEKSKIRGKIYRENNKQYILNRDREKYLQNKEEILVQRKDFYDKNKISILNRISEYQKNNRDVNRKAQRAHYKNNKPIYMAKSAKRRASKFKATPSWLTDIHKMQIQWYYEAAKMMTDTSGVKHHVDHIHPLQGNKFTGLHVPWNLRVVKAKDNIAKSNKLDDSSQHLSWGI